MLFICSFLKIMLELKKIVVQIVNCIKYYLMISFMFLCLFFCFSLASTFVLLNYVVVVVLFPFALALPILLLRLILLLLLPIFPVSSLPIHVDGQNLDQTFTKGICS